MVVWSGLGLFVFVCVFDPANKLTGLKSPLFGGLWLVTLYGLAINRSGQKLPTGLLAYVLCFIAIPLLSVVWYFVIDGTQPFEGFQLLKGYVLVSIALVLFLNRCDSIPLLCAALTSSAVLSVALFVYLEINPHAYDHLKQIADPTGVLILDKRKFGPQLELLQVYLASSPMLVVSAAYYFHRGMTESDRRWMRVCWSLVALNLAGLIVGGTRNNILGALILPFLLWPLYQRQPLRSALVSVGLLALCVLPALGTLRALFDMNEPSNHIKLELLHDYLKIFSNDPVTLLLGQGLGAYQYWGAKGGSSYISELTYLELVRNFGLIGAVAMMTLLLAPISLAFATGSQRQRALVLSYGLYLVACATNPNLFSSMGILILSILLASAAMERPLSSHEPTSAPRLG
ncbi:O-antigen ligase family protein [Bradyrhizobium ganzhouense]|uniref:O-antigen ligase family protein n=1 Tax=Bradyrhizobium ganzhouense TaxID=1179767 RepID=UPI003CF89FA1